VQDDLPKLLCPNDDFILFFSGHGDSRPYQTGSFKGENGYLIPYDGRDQGVSSLIEVKAFLEEVGHLPARHILVILDACHSGIAVEDAQQGMKASGDYQAALESRNSRKVIVSALPATKEPSLVIPYSEACCFRVWIRGWQPKVKISSLILSWGNL
jgi:uncharacterized caspase-like protein